MSGVNRENVRAGGQGKSWCDCDRVVIGETRKCSVCRRRNGRRRGKPADANLPSLMDLRGIAPNATGGISSEDYVRHLRAAARTPRKRNP